MNRSIQTGLSNLLNCRALTHACILAVLLIQPLSALSAESNVLLSQQSHFRVTYTPAIDPIPINTIHQWLLHLTWADGTPVNEAIISVTGGMPDHNHGMPTEPQVTDMAPSGEYLLEGVRFHMMGRWELTLSIQAGDTKDRLIIPLHL